MLTNFAGHYLNRWVSRSPLFLNWWILQEFVLTKLFCRHKFSTSIILFGHRRFNFLWVRNCIFGVVGIIFLVNLAFLYFFKLISYTLLSRNLQLFLIIDQLHFGQISFYCLNSLDHHPVNFFKELVLTVLLFLEMIIRHQVINSRIKLFFHLSLQFFRILVKLETQLL